MVVGRISVGRGGQRRGRDPARLPPGCPLVTMVARAPLPGSGAFIGGVSVDILVVLLVAWM